jgi:hypothetical protein
MVNINKIFGVVKLIIALVCFLFSIYPLFIINSPKLNNALINSMYSSPYLSKGTIESGIGFSVISMFLIYGLAGLYYFFSGLYELKSKEPLNVVLRIVVNILPALFVSFLFFVSLSVPFTSQTFEWAGGHFIVLFIMLVFAVAFWREMWLGKIFERRMDKDEILEN